MTQTQEHLLKLVLEIDRLCRKHDIQYFLAFGSILGAVRHHGFIPWDNDVDLSMPQEDYERFRQVCREELDPETRVFVDNRDNREYPVVFGHYVDRTSCRMTNRTNFWDDYVGQCIDIFCMVELPPDPEEARRAKDRFFAYDEFVNRSFMHYMQKTPAVMAHYRAFQERAAREGRETVLRELEQEVFGHRYEGADTYLLCSARSCNPSPFVPKRPFDTPAEALFEGHPLFIPGDYVTVLEHYYGEDFNLFPRDKRIHTEMSHAGLPARVYVKDFMRGTDRAVLLRDRAAAKDARVELCVRETEQTTAYYRMLAAQTISALQREAARRGVEFAALAKTVDAVLAGDASTDADIRALLREADGLFDTWYRRQLCGDAGYWRCVIDIGADAVYCAMAYLWLVKGDRKGLRRLFALYAETEHSLTARMRTLKEAFDDYGNVRRYLLYGNLARAQESLARCEVRFAGRHETRAWRAQVCAKTADSEEVVRSALTLTEELLAEQPGEDAVQKARADLLLLAAQQGAAGCAQEAAALYRALKQTSGDGFLLQDIARREEEGLVL